MKNIKGPTIVYVEAVLMPNREVIHYGKSLGLVNKRQLEMVAQDVCGHTKGEEKIIVIHPEKVS
jgi:hypothetical protein